MGWSQSVVAFSFAAAIVIPVVLIVLRQISAIVLSWLPGFSRLRLSRPTRGHWDMHLHATSENLALREGQFPVPHV